MSQRLEKMKCPVCGEPTGLSNGNHLACDRRMRRACVDNREVWSDAPAAD